jgi:hypothetical protein
MNVWGVCMYVRMGHSTIRQRVRNAYSGGRGNACPAVHVADGTVLSGIVQLNLPCWRRRCPLSLPSDPIKRCKRNGGFLFFILIQGLQTLRQLIIIRRCLAQPKKIKKIQPTKTRSVIWDRNGRGSQQQVNGRTQENPSGWT